MPDYRNRPPVDQPPPSIWRDLREAGPFVLAGTVIAFAGALGFAVGGALALSALFS